jgi:hypothetical protein
VKREAEMTQISKIMHPGYKGPAGGSTLYSHTASTANKVFSKKAGNTNNQTGGEETYQKQTTVAARGRQNPKKNPSPHRNGRQPTATTSKAGTKGGNSSVFEYGKNGKKSGISK